MAEEPCPCKQKMSDAEKNAMTIGINDIANILRNPNAAALGALNNAFQSNGTGLGTLIANASAGGAPAALAAALPALNNAKAQFDSMKNLTTSFAGECNKLTDPKNLLRIVSSLGLYAELNCAFGIPGLDITGGFGVVNQNGQLALQGGLNAQLQLGGLLEEVGSSPVGAALDQLQNGLNSVSAAMTQANNAINEVVALTQQVQTEAFGFIQKYTSVNGLFNLVNLANEDSCFKLGTAVNASLISPEFYNAVSAASVATPLGGTSTR